MDSTEHLHETLPEIHMELSRLKTRKQKLLQCEITSEYDSGQTLSNHHYAEYKRKLSQFREPVQNPRVVYQGEPGAYSEMACRDFFGESVIAVGLDQFEDTFHALERGEADYAVLPIENSCTGPIRQVYDLLQQYACFFVGETTVQVNHALMALPGTSLSEITTVYSHEQGLMQCADFLSRHPHWQQVPQADTAGSARLVAELGDRHIAAICSALAAEIYGLQIVEEKVNTEASNITRFFVIAPTAEKRENRDKIFISFTDVGHPDALQHVIGALTLHHIRLLHLESRPIPGRNWEYMYFLELTGDLLVPEVDCAMRELFVRCADLRVLGNFHSSVCGGI